MFAHELGVLESLGISKYNVTMLGGLVAAILSLASHACMLFAFFFFVFLQNINYQYKYIYLLFM